MLHRITNSLQNEWTSLPEYSLHKFLFPKLVTKCHASLVSAAPNVEYNYSVPERNINDPDINPTAMIIMNRSGSVGNPLCHDATTRLLDCTDDLFQILGAFLFGCMK